MFEALPIFWTIKRLVLGAFLTCLSYYFNHLNYPAQQIFCWLYVQNIPRRARGIPGPGVASPRCRTENTLPDFAWLHLRSDTHEDIPPRI